MFFPFFSQRFQAKILKFRYSSKAPKVNKASCNNTSNNNVKDDNNNGCGNPRWDMEEIKSNVALLLEGKPYEEMHEFCDFSLEEQNDVQLAKVLFSNLVTFLQFLGNYLPFMG